MYYNGYDVRTDGGEVTVTDVNDRLFEGIR